ncbi:GPP34 family phosphoprotein [Imperialibacter roseus]|uniref:GPP34 family phosphoprotein n=1 Tax=Imperialibacter roseus TaxID=1324217 RepID=A0ABZ0IUL2_9BACT|nr:GPP34 family phosphoprotein [Imperialibacter roseus]WOK08732.1 GPP34 family phosphoprotein [Imperialibacter roseus]
MRLSLAEGLLLIALDDNEGRLLADAEKGIIDALVAAGIFELNLLRKIGFEGGKITIKDTTSSGNKILDHILSGIGSGGKSVKDTVVSLSPQMRSLYEMCIDLLIGRGILKREATRLLWIPISERMDNANYAYEKEIRDSLKSIVLKGVKPTPAFVILASLLGSLEILDEVFTDKDELIDAIKFAKDSVHSGTLPAEVASSLDEVKEHIAAL